MKCTANTKTCRKCKYRYPAGSKLTACPQCGEPRKCTRSAVTGYTVCQVHGAGSRKRPGGRPVVTGRYSKYLPKRIAGRYEEALNDPLKLELDDEIAVARARLTELLDRADSGESYQAWIDAKNLYIELTDALKKQDVVTSNFCLQELNKVIGKGVHDYASWSEVRAQTAHYVKLVESQRKRQVESQQMITVEQMTLLMGAVVEVIRRALVGGSYKNDQERFNVISAELNKLLYIGAGEKV